MLLAADLHYGASFNVAYNYVLESELNGALLAPGRVVPRSSVDTRVSVHGGSFGVFVLLRNWWSLRALSSIEVSREMFLQSVAKQIRIKTCIN